MAEKNFRALESANKGKTYFLLASMGLLTWLVTYAAMTYFGLGTASTMVPIAVGISLIGVWGSYYGSDKLVLTMTGAKLITREDAPELFNVIEEVVIASGLPMPKVAIVEDTAPNAFATGRDPDHALIAFTTRILDVMDRDELQGVIAHELAHVANRDTVVRQKSNAVAHIWIESPLDGQAVSKMFSTHPPIQERIATLRAMESLGPTDS